MKANFFTLAAVLLAATFASAQNRQPTFGQTQMVDPAMFLRWHLAGQPVLPNHPEPVVVQSRGSQEFVVSADASAESEIHAAINPTDSTNVVVAFVSTNFGGFPPVRTMVSFTKDFGQTWADANLNFAPDGFLVFGGGQPVVAFSDNGTAHIVWLTLYYDFLNIQYRLRVNRPRCATVA